MNWARDFGRQEGPARPVRDLEDAPREMRQELLDVFFGLAEQNVGGGLSDERIHRVVSQSLGIHPAGNPYGGYRYAAGRDIGPVAWQRVYDLIPRLWPLFDAANLSEQYREGVNRVLAGYGAAWDLGADGHLHRVLPTAGQVVVNAAFEELQVPEYAAAWQLMTHARDAYDDRPRRDRDSCSNAFDAMESVAKVKYNLPNNTFGQVKNHIEQNRLLRAEIIAMLTALNQLRNGHFGHGMAVQFGLTAAEVDFVYLTCVSVILLLIRTP